MKKDRGKPKRQKQRSLFGVIINPAAENFSQKAVDRLISSIAKKKANWHVIKTDSPREAIYQIKKLLQRRPAGMIACGGDGTVNMVARNMIRRTSVLGIYPLGKCNDIYRSIHGSPSLREARNHIFSGHHIKIDYGVADNKFFLGSVGFGLISEMHDLLEKKRIPRFGIGWSRASSQAAARVKPVKRNLIIDQFRYDITPLVLNVNLLTYSMGLPVTPMSLPDDGCAEVVFDPDAGKAIMSGFIRKLRKKKYIYSDEIAVYRGKKISISPVKGERMYLDGDIWEIDQTEMEIEIFQAKIRLFKAAPEED